MFCSSCSKGCYQNALTTRLQYGVHCYIESSTFQLAAASVSTRSVGSVDHGFFGGLGGSHCEDRKSVVFFFYQYELCLMHTACTVLKALLLDVSTGSQMNDVFLGGLGEKAFFN